MNDMESLKIFLSYCQLPPDVARHIVKMAYSVPEQPIVESFLNLCGRYRCREIGNLWIHDNCCQTYDRIVRENNHIRSIVLNRRIAMESHSGDYDDHDPHKRCRVPEFELPSDIRHLRQLRKLILKYLPITGRIPLEWIGLKKLEVLRLQRYNAWDCEKYHTISVPPFMNLKELHLGEFKITTENIVEISEIKTLKQLNLSLGRKQEMFVEDDARANGSNIDFSSLSKLPKLEVLCISMDRINVRSFRGIPSLRELWLLSGRCKPTDSVSIAFLESFLHECVNLNSCSLCIPVCGFFSSKFFDHPTLEIVLLKSTNSRVKSIDFNREEYPKCRYTGCLEYTDNYSVFNISAMGDVPVGYDNMGITQ